MVFKITGKLYQKSELSAREKQDGFKFTVINFIISKTKNKKQSFFAFATYNNNAEYISQLALNSKIVVGFHPQSKFVQKSNYWATSLIASEIELYVKRIKSDKDSALDFPDDNDD